MQICAWLNLINCCDEHIAIEEEEELEKNGNISIKHFISCSMQCVAAFMILLLSVSRCRHALFYVTLVKYNIQCNRALLHVLVYKWNLLYYLFYVSKPIKIMLAPKWEKKYNSRSKRTFNQPANNPSNPTRSQFFFAIQIVLFSTIWRWVIFRFIFLTAFWITESSMFSHIFF